MKIGLLIYFGRINNFARLSIEMISKQLDQVHIITDDLSFEPIERNIHIEFITSDALLERIKIKLGIYVKDFKYYKLCDFKPVWPLLFEKAFDDNSVACIFDVDCLWGNISSYLISSGNSKVTIFGNRGHLLAMPFGYARGLPVSFNIYYGEKWKHILSDKKFYAFDEFDYFHKFLKNEEKYNKIYWKKDVSINSIDVDYWSARPININNKSTIEFLDIIKKDNKYHLRVKYKEGNFEEVPYIHLQKRPYSNFSYSQIINLNNFYCNFMADGSFLFSKNHISVHHNYQQWRWFIKIFFSRLKFKLINF